MTKRDILELKRRLKKSECTFTKMSGCYVNANKEKVLTFNQDFRDLADEEYYKYLDLANKVLSGTVGNNLLKLDFSKDAEEPLGPQQVLLGIRESNLLNEGLLDTFYQHVIDNFYFTGNYLIILFKDTYDVPLKTSDNLKMDDSEEVYEYILCAVCPVDLSKPALGYLQDDNRIGARIRDWVVGMPEIGFVFPLFDERSANIHSTLFYTKNTKEPHDEFMKQVLGCGLKHTANERKETFKNIVIKAAQDEEKGQELFTTIQGGLNDIIKREELEGSNETESNPEVQTLLTKDTILSLPGTIDVPELIINKIANTWDEHIDSEDDAPAVKQIIDKKLAEKATVEEEKRSLIKENASLREQIKVHEEIDIEEESHEEDVILRVSKKKADKITTQIIDGKKYIMIPVEDDQNTFINGIKM